MQTERKTPELEAILDVFRKLGLEDTEVQKRLQEMAKPNSWHPLGERQKTPQDTRNNTLPEDQDAQLEPTS